MNKMESIIRHKSKGLSLIELMLYIGLVAAIIAGVMKIAQMVRDNAQKMNTKQTLRLTKAAIEQYKVDTGKFPANLNDLIKRPSGEKDAKKWQGPYIADDMLQNDAIVDAYGYDLEYKLTDNGRKFDLYSVGKGGPGSDSGALYVD